MIVYLPGLILCIGIAVLGIRKRIDDRHLALALAAYALLTALILTLQAAGQFGWLAAFRVAVVQQAPIYGVLILAWVMIPVSAFYVRRAPFRWTWWLPGLALIAILIALDANLFNLPDPIWQNAAWRLSLPRLTDGILLAGWAGFTLTSAGMALRAYISRPQPLHRNRVLYWGPVLTIIIAGDAMAFAGLPATGITFHLLAAGVILWLAGRYHLPDLSLIQRRLLSQVLAALLTMALYTAGFLGAESLLQRSTWFQPLWVGVILAGVLVLLFNPILGLVNRLVEHWITRTSRGPGQALHDYSSKISNLLDLDRLAAISVDQISAAMGAPGGALYLVRIQGESEIQGYELQGIRGADLANPTSLVLEGSSPIAAFFCQERLPLTQYDLDLQPRFKSASPQEKAWFSASRMDVYVPIFVHGDWIGLFTFAPKRSGNRYFPNDLALLSSLADQTGTALENARLVKNLVLLNQELRKAYDTLNRATRKLEKLDRTKSNFISVASHELRTPLSLLVGYIEMLAENPTLRSDPMNLMMVEGIGVGISRLNEIVESMLSMAALDTRTFRVDPEPVALPVLVQKIAHDLEQAASERRLALETTAITGLPSIEADQKALQKVFEHLIGNAVKYTPDGGRIEVGGQALPRAESPLQQDSVEIVVSDTGIGIDAESQELIFTKFYQTGDVMHHSTSKTHFKGGGPGLGLSIVRGIVEAHNGRVWVESPGYDETTCPGSRFHVILPQRQNDPDRPAPPAPQDTLRLIQNAYLQVKAYYEGVQENPNES